MYHGKYPPPTKKEEPYQDHLDEEDAPAVFILGKRIEKEGSKKPGYPYCQDCTECRVPRGKLTGHIIKIEDIYHDRIQEQGEDSCTCMGVEDISCVPKTNPWGKIGGQNYKGYIPQEQEPFLAGEKRYHSVRIGYGLRVFRAT